MINKKKPVRLISSRLFVTIKHKYLVNIKQTNKQYQVSLIRHKRIIHGIINC